MHGKLKKKEEELNNNNTGSFALLAQQRTHTHKSAM